MTIRGIEIVSRCYVCSMADFRGGFARLESCREMCAVEQFRAMKLESKREQGFDYSYVIRDMDF